LELAPPDRVLFSALRHWGVARCFSAVGMHRVIGFRAADLPCRLAPHLCAIAAEGDLLSGAVQAGRLLQRFWLRATTLQLSCHVFAASPVYALEGSTAIDPEMRSALASGWGTLCPPNYHPFVIVRMGRADAPSVRSGRPPSRDFVDRDGA